MCVYWIIYWIYTDIFNQGVLSIENDDIDFDKNVTNDGSIQQSKITKNINNINKFSFISKSNHVCFHCFLWTPHYHWRLWICFRPNWQWCSQFKCVSFFPLRLFLLNIIIFEFDIIRNSKTSFDSILYNTETTCQFNGKLNINFDYTPAVGDSFAVVEYQEYVIN